MATPVSATSSGVVVGLIAGQPAAVVRYERRADILIALL
jgi:hypothetical protein